MNSVLVLDPGHGGVNRGCSANGLVEKTLTLHLAKSVQALARAAGLAVELTRERDETTNFAQRRSRACLHSAKQVVSLHFDSATVDTMGGMTCYCEAVDSQSLSLARRILRFAPSVVAMATTPVLVEPYGWKSRACHVVRSFHSLPTLLVECAYLTNGEHAEFLKDGGCTAIAATILAAVKAEAAGW